MKDRFPRARAAIFILLFIALPIAPAACSKAGFQTSDIYKVGKDDAVSLIWRTDVNGGIVPDAYSHPADIPPDKLARALSSINYSELIFFQWKDKGPVFIDTEVEKLAAPMSKALAAANQNQWVSFKVTSFKRDLLFKSKRLTSGWAWVKDGKLNIVLGDFRFEMSDETEPYDGDPRERYALTTYRIETGPALSKPPIDPKDEILKREHQNWAIIDLANLPEPKAEAKTPPAETNAPPSAKERLEELKKLLDGGLITQEEYDRKKAEILKEL